MRKRILFLGDDRGRVCKIKREFSGCEKFINICFHLTEAVDILRADNSFLLIVFFFHNTIDISHIKIIRDVTNIPILVLQENYNSLEKIAVIDAGADEYIQWTGNTEEIIVSCRALIRRYTVFNQQNIVSTEVTIHGGVFINESTRKIFIYGDELKVARREFDLFCHLASQPKRIFTYEQLFNQIWGIEQTPTENSLHSCIRRIRRKLESIPGCPCSIKNVYGVGYTFQEIESKKTALLLR